MISFLGAKRPPVDYNAVLVSFCALEIKLKCVALCIHPVDEDILGKDFVVSL